MMEEKIYTITELSELLSLSDATIRKYEKDYDLKIPRNELGHRFYTNKELEVLNQIIKLKEQGANIHVIKKILSRSVEANEQNETALELVTLDKLTGAELKKLMLNQIGEMIIQRESELSKQYEEKLDEIKFELKDEIKNEFIHEREQRLMENQKLMDYIAVAREENNKKGFLRKIFKK